MRIGKAALAHVSLFASPYARELTVSACPNLPPQVNLWRSSSSSATLSAAV